MYFYIDETKTLLFSFDYQENETSNNIYLGWFPSTQQAEDAYDAYCKKVGK